MTIRVTGISRALLKGATWDSIEYADVSSHGIEHDREFLVVQSETGMFVAQRRSVKEGLGVQVKTLCQITPDLQSGRLILNAPDMNQLELDATNWQRSNTRQVQVWKSVCTGNDMGDEAADWLNAFLGQERQDQYRLVQRPGIFTRKSKSGKALVGYHDAYPFLIISQASIDDLNRRIVERGGEALPMNRFRPNLVLDGCEPYEEDRMKRIRIGDMVLEGDTLCKRCPVTMTDQLTAVRGPEPYRTLFTYRRIPETQDVEFGRNFDHLISGSVEIGQEVQVLEWD